MLVIIPLMIFVWPRFDRTLWIQIAFCVVIGWWLMTVTLEAEIGETLRELADKSSAGLELTSEEKQFDGTGDRAVSLQVGWFPPLVIAAIACGVRWGFRRLFNRLSNPSQQAT
ncbi:MAG: hypothetical protein AAF911_07710 [Planctomycetota bacterium]